MQRLARPNGRFAVLALASLSLAALTTVVVRQRAGTDSQPVITSSTPLVALSTTTESESELRDKDIAFYAKRVSEDPGGATDRIALASLLFTRSRITGSAPDLARAETLARESVALRNQRNGHAFEVLASILMARHAFTEAHTIALQADSLEPNTPSHLALLGEIELELGEYPAAATHYRAVHSSGQQFTVGARVARWHEVTGNASLARDMLKRAIVDVDRRDDLPREQVAWFHYRLGELELRLGNLTAADSAFHTALQRHPNDIRVLGGLARTALARNDYRQAITYGDQATNIQLDPTTLATVSQAYLAINDSAQAAAFANAMSISVLTQPGAIHRQWGLYLLDHGSAAQRADVLRRARAELQDRHDVYGHDLMAWALYRNGQLEPAREEMRLALSQHTEDLMLTTHANALGVSSKMTTAIARTER